MLLNPCTTTKSILPRISFPLVFFFVTIVLMICLTFESNIVSNMAVFSLFGTEVTTSEICVLLQGQHQFLTVPDLY